MRSYHLVLLLVLLTLVAASAPTPAHAGGVVSVCDEAHLLAALTGGGTVTFSCSGTITLTAEIVISADMTIDGSGQTVTISGNHAVRIFFVNSGRTLNLNRLTVAAGSITGNGGGIHNDNGILTVSDSSIVGNSVTYGSGSGIYNNRGTVTVSNSTFSDNHARNNAGGGICNVGGAVRVSNSVLFDNIANQGGAIYTDGTLTVNDSTFSGNIASLGGGILNSYGTLTASNTTFSGNGANHAGGGIYNALGIVNVNDSTFSSNSADWGGGGFFQHYGALTVTNSTLTDNNAGFAGGGVFCHYGTLIVSNSTFSGNSASFGGGIDNYEGAATLKNTIVANSPTGGNCAGAMTNGGGNLSYPDSTCPGINRDPKLGPLQDNGGPTHTMALLPGSWAIDAGNDATCAAAPVNNLDQRGVARPYGSHCDSGAYEAPLSPMLPRAYLPLILK